MPTLVVAGAALFAFTACGAPEPFTVDGGLPRNGTDARSASGGRSGSGGSFATGGAIGFGSGGRTGFGSGGQGTGGQPIASGGTMGTGGAQSGGAPGTGGRGTGGASTGGAATGGRGTGGVSGAGGNAGTAAGGRGTGGTGVGGRGTGGAATGGAGGSTGTTPCAGLCTAPITVAIGVNSGGLGTTATCHQAIGMASGLVCGNFVTPRVLTVNGTMIPCTSAGLEIPAPRNGGYCVQTTAGNQSYAYFSLYP